MNNNDLKEKLVLEQLMQIKKNENKLKKEIMSNVKDIFKEFNSEALYHVDFDDARVAIELTQAGGINTKIIGALNEYFGEWGRISYSEGDGFLILYGVKK